jgi:hypothetical protein
MGGDGEGRGRDWLRRGRMSFWEGEQWILPQEKRESEGGESRDEKMMMIKLIV